AIDDVREKIATTKADLDAVRAAPLPSAVCKNIATAEIDRLAEAGRIGVQGLVDHGAPLQWPTSSQRADIHATADGASTRAIVTGFANLKAVDTPPLIAWLFKDALIASV